MAFASVVRESLQNLSTGLFPDPSPHSPEEQMPVEQDPPAVSSLTQHSLDAPSLQLCPCRLAHPEGGGGEHQALASGAPGSVLSKKAESQGGDILKGHSVRPTDADPVRIALGANPAPREPSAHTRRPPGNTVPIPDLQTSLSKGGYSSCLVRSILKVDAMERKNTSFPSTFVLLGFSEFPWLEVPLSAVVLVSYILTLMGNSSILLLSLLDPRLHTPMYFFLDNLSLLDLSLTCTIVPQLLANLWGTQKTIAAWGCITQVYMFTWTACTECILLAVMAIDRYVAICRPLRYTLIMRPWVCVQMAAASWSSGLVNALLQVTLTLQLPLCGHHILDHFFCEVPVLIKLACGDTTANDLALTLMTIPFAVVPVLLVLVSYTLITRAVLKLPSAEGRHNALSTCSSHLLVVTLYFGPGTYLYFQPSVKSSQAKFISFFYCAITPLLNPLIYTLRNKDVKTAWKRMLQSQGWLKSLKARRPPPVF
ncbi:PREDICTED: olfactory receptor 15-like [Chinchilla lanigera]|uniref:olfactory receptor 15-like n=1 Tax=Chinchilla lanigera TaxID=34839 RepID=UPI000695E9A4|nr:PREDICTED: olfactory receptor 15-like [Chinchilla lanigera]